MPKTTAEGGWYPWRLEGVGFPLAGGRRLYGVSSPLLFPQECVRFSQAHREPERKAIQIVVCPELEHRLHPQTRINCGLPEESSFSCRECKAFHFPSLQLRLPSLHLRLKKHYGAFTCVLAYTVIFDVCK